MNSWVGWSFVIIYFASGVGIFLFNTKIDCHIYSFQIFIYLFLFFLIFLSKLNATEF